MVTAYDIIYKKDEKLTVVLEVILPDGNGKEDSKTNKIFVKRNLSKGLLVD